MLVEAWPWGISCLSHRRVCGTWGSCPSCPVLPSESRELAESDTGGVRDSINSTSQTLKKQVHNWSCFISLPLALIPADFYLELRGKTRSRCKTSSHRTVL